MTSVEDVARHVASIANATEDVLLIGEWAAQRWTEIVNATGGTLRTLRRLGELYIEPVYTTGTVDITAGSRTVTGTSTVWTTNMVGRSLRTTGAWREIESVQSATSLTLKTPYGENADADGAGYTIAEVKHKLEPKARKLGVFVHMRLRRPLEISSSTGLMLAQPGRNQTNSVPLFVAEVEPDANHVRQVEIYPYSTRRETIHYVYWEESIKLGFKDVFPGFVDLEALREGVLVDVFRHKMVKAIDAGQTEAAALWRNEYRAQETKWKNEHRVRVLAQDIGMDDLEFILERNPAHPSYRRDQVIDDAYSHVWLR